MLLIVLGINFGRSSLRVMFRFGSFKRGLHFRRLDFLPGM
jgi:hypothetical protein